MTETQLNVSRIRAMIGVEWNAASNDFVRTGAEMIVAP